ncbi:MAG: hypothetical protein HRU18_01535 [Pseudoalteromonas sp.]|uniref:hypothetical protein n=1 Tax=Pseudoalteromonas sp. TaxID=53249 RepID=UPI001E159425|nr:hypothetical protein [Pseudoalteromonas sp.]NRA76863.1 hypothetical protein [Pseudoalteromonas sp.]
MKFKITNVREKRVSTAKVGSERLTLKADEKEKIISFTDYKKFEKSLESLKASGIILIEELTGKKAEGVETSKPASTVQAPVVEETTSGEGSEVTGSEEETKTPEAGSEEESKEGEGSESSEADTQETTEGGSDETEADTSDNAGDGDSDASASTSEGESAPTQAPQQNHEQAQQRGNGKRNRNKRNR